MEYVQTVSLKHSITKALNLLHGPTVSMSDFQKRRVKRKTITLVKKVYLAFLISFAVNRCFFALRFLANSKLKELDTRSSNVTPNK